MTSKAKGMERQGDELALARQGLAQGIMKWVTQAGQTVDAVPGLWLHRFEGPTEPVSYVMDPSVCLIAQGAKRVLLGDEAYGYDADHFLVTSVGLPVVAQITEASPGKPYLGLRLELDQRTMAKLMLDSDLPTPRSRQADRGMAVGDVTLPLLGAFRRLVDLLDTPEDIPILAPLIQREILYRLLVGEQGPRLRQIALAGSHSNQIARALDWLQLNYAQPLRIDDLAERTGMSPSSLHHHFRAMTAMSPLQYQKMLRLQEARRLLLSESLDATSAAFQVGYESASQFSREYSRLFGAPPMRDIKRLHQSVQAGGARMDA